MAIGEDLRRILVVEDDQHLADALRRGLAGEGFQVVVATDGLEARSRHTFPIHGSR
ncbi:MAG: hypothetical protein ABJA87_05625 [bacterium]